MRRKGLFIGWVVICLAMIAFPWVAQWAAEAQAPAGESPLGARGVTVYRPMGREEGSPTTVYVKLIDCPTWYVPGPMEEHRVEIFDCDGRRIVWFDTGESGVAVLQASLPEVVTVRVDTGQSVMVERGEGNLGVAFWLGHCALEAASWERGECGE